MKAKQLDKIIAAVKEHMIEALAYFYEEAQVGDNALELKIPRVCKADYDNVYLIIGIEMMFDENPKGVMNYHQKAENGTKVTKFPLHLLSNQILLSLLKAYEKQMKCYYKPVIDLDIKKLSA